MPRRGGPVERKVERSSFRTYFQHTNTTTTNVIGQYSLTLANLGDRASDIGENFEFFRIVRLHIYAFLDTTGPSGTASATVGTAQYHAISFLNTPTASQTIPGSLQAMVQHERFATGNGVMKLSIRVGRRELLSEPFKWFNTETTGSVPASSVSAGTITYLLATGFSATPIGITQLVFLEGDIEYHTPIDYPDSLRVHIPRRLADTAAVVKAVEKVRAVVEDAD